MSDHLPECLLPDFDKGVWVCICKQLRACEQRAAQESYPLLFDKAYAAGVQAAREAVAALPQPITFCGVETFAKARSIFLAAIDALKEK